MIALPERHAVKVLRAAQNWPPGEWTQRAVVS